MGNKSKFTAASCIAVLVLTGCTFAPSFSEDEKLDMRDSTSGYQQAVLQDLVVTETEYREAVDATRTCLQDKGSGVGTIEQDGQQLGFTSSYSGENGPSNEDMQACNDEYMAQIGPTWVSQRAQLTR